MKKLLGTTKYTNRIIWIVAVFAVWYLVIASYATLLGIPFGYLAKKASPALAFVTLYYTSVVWTIVVFVLFCIAFKKNRFILEEMLPPKAKQIPGKLLTGILLGFLSNFFCILCALLHGDIKLYCDFSLSAIPVMLYAFISVFFQSASEEMWCRGFLYERINIHYPLWVAILLNGIIFGLMHIMNDGVTVLAIADIIICGITYSLLRWYTGSIWASFGIHTMWNFTQNFIFGLPNSGLVSEVSIFHLDAATGISNAFYSYEFGVEGAWPAVFIDFLLGAVIVFLGWRSGRIGEFLLSREDQAYVEPESEKPKYVVFYERSDR